MKFKLCENCKKFFIGAAEACLNCGVADAELQRFLWRAKVEEGAQGMTIFSGVFIFVGLGLTLCAPLVRIPPEATVTVRDLVTVSLGLSIVSAIACGISLLVATFSSPQPIIPETRESLQTWQKQLAGKINEINAQLKSVQENLKADFLNAQEKKPFVLARKNLTEKKKQAEQKINSFEVLRWLNAGEAFILNSLNQESPDNLLTGKIKDLAQQGENLLKLDLSDGDRRAVQEFIPYLKRQETDILRQRSLKLLESITDSALVADELLEEERETRSDRLRLTAGISNPITSDLFEKEKFRLEILEILK